MNIGLFIPCYIDQFYPRVGIALVELLERVGCQISYPLDQTCCGQPLANNGMESEARGVYSHFINTFGSYDYVVAPSASCVYHIRHHYDILEQTKAVIHLRDRTLDVVEFLTDVLKTDNLNAYFPHRVGLHQSCHGLRGLELGKPTELMIPDFSKIKYLLSQVRGIEMVELDTPDECCGFGGTFAVKEEAISVKMGKDRIADHEKNGVEVITATDMSCLMHLEGIIRREKKDLRVMHVVEILNSG